MRSEWETTTLGTLGDFRNGVNFNREQEGHGLPVLKVKDFGDRVLCPLDSLDELSSALFRASPQQLLAENDIVVIRSNGNPALVGRSVVVQKVTRPTTFSGFCIRFRPDATRIDPRFAAYFLRSPLARERMTQFGSGTGIQNLNQDILAGLPIVLPALDQQIAISDVLASLDDKIEQNRRTGRKLEALARAVFKAWFVDFEPLKAKAAGATAFPGMPAETFATLPTRLVDSELGPVPEGWAVKPLSKAATFLNGLALQKYPPGDDGADLPVIKIAELRKGSTESADLANARIPSEFVVEDGDLLFSWSGTLEVELWFGGRGALNQHLFKIASKEYPRWLCLHWVRQHLPEFRLIAASKATTMGHIKRGHLDAAMVVIPDATTLAAAEDVMGPVYEMVTNLAIESRRLAALRDYLLPRLLSGRVRVREAGAHVGRVA